LGVVLDPEVLRDRYDEEGRGNEGRNTYDSTAETWPRVWARVECMPVSQPRIRRPHNLLQLQELGHETRQLVVDLRCIRRNYNAILNQSPKLDGKCGKLTVGMHRGLDIPQ
jgi:hypothetical protein